MPCWDHGQKQRDHVSHNIRYGVAIPERRQIDTMSRHALVVPDARDWSALEDRRDDAGKCVEYDVGDSGIGAIAEGTAGEDLQVEEADGSFGQVDGELVDDLGDPEGLKGFVHVVGSEGIEVFAVAVLDGFVLISSLSPLVVVIIAIHTDTIGGCHGNGKDLSLYQRLLSYRTISCDRRHDQTPISRNRKGITHTRRNDDKITQKQFAL